MKTFNDYFEIAEERHEVLMDDGDNSQGERVSPSLSTAGRDLFQLLQTEFPNSDLLGALIQGAIKIMRYIARVFNDVCEVAKY